MPGWPVWASCVSALSAGLILTEPYYRWRAALFVCVHWRGFVSGSKAKSSHRHPENGLSYVAFIGIKMVAHDKPLYQEAIQL